MVSLAKGGGTINVDVERDKNRSEVFQLAKDLYFPTVLFFIANFNGNEIGEYLTSGKEFTIANYFECLKRTPQRIYLHTNLLDTSNQETTQSNNSPTHTIESQPSCSSNHCL
ncbi:hypothetical protein SNE40_002537 [Patella caerulea]|uniref:Uncharacterized protein n=1 Tax=Patella caerulea TaxID=87958 RepID=A0AAN8KC14_PATCE